MSWKEKVVGLYNRFGTPVKFAAKLVLGSVVPGGSAVVDLVGLALDCVHETVNDQIEDEARMSAVTAADLQRLEGVLDLLSGDLGDVMAKVAALEKRPDLAAATLELALKNDARGQAALHKLDHLARGIEGLHSKSDHIQAKIDEVRGLVLALGNQRPAAPISTQPTIAMARPPLAADREAFLRIVQDYTSFPVRERYARILDDFIRWSEAHVGKLEFQPRGQRQQATFTYRLAGEPIVFWDAYPRKTDGAKFIALPDLPGQRVPEELREKLRQAFAKFENQETGADKPIPTLSFRTLEVEETRNAVKRCLAEVLALLHPSGLNTNLLGMKFARIPPGAFLMGSPPNEPERRHDEAQHGVTLTKGFHMGIHQVTQAQWQAVMPVNPSAFKAEHDLPVDNVSWEDCATFCDALGKQDGEKYRLPTEAEWEYACRAGTTTPFHFGGTISVNQSNYDGNYVYCDGKKGLCRKKTTQVGRFSANAWGLYDMHGNVWEWCADWFGLYQEEELKDPLGFVGGGGRVCRGGSWTNRPRDCRSASRAWHAPAYRRNYLALRVCLLLD